VTTISRLVWAGLGLENFVALLHRLCTSYFQVVHSDVLPCKSKCRDTFQSSIHCNVMASSRSGPGRALPFPPLAQATQEFVDEVMKFRTHRAVHTFLLQINCFSFIGVWIRGKCRTDVFPLEICNLHCVLWFALVPQLMFSLESLGILQC
jgi:hypothetical protein